MAKSKCKRCNGRGRETVGGPLFGFITTCLDCYGMGSKKETDVTDKPRRWTGADLTRWRGEMSPEDAAEHLGVTPCEYNTYEHRGLSDIPHFVEKLAVALGSPKVSDRVALQRWVDKYGFSVLDAAHFLRGESSNTYCVLNGAATLSKETRRRLDDFDNNLRNYIKTHDILGREL